MTIVKSKLCFVITLIILMFTQCHSDSRHPDWVVRSMNIAQQQAKGMLPIVLNSGKFPRSLESGLCPTDDWTSGFYPGILWLLYEYTKEVFWKEAAEKATCLLENEQYNTKDHDIGFRILCSYGNGWLLTGNEEYESVIIRAASSLATRFNEKTQTIMSWDARLSRDWEYPVIIDNMMNLELLMKASKLSGISRLREIAVAHANQTIKYHYRSNYSCSHVVDYDPQSGEFRKMDWNNGFSDPQVSSWSRGQGWGLYGFTMMYRETRDIKYLDQAEKIAEFILDHPNMPEDLIPYWDFSSPEIPTIRDASAAAVIASALMELCVFSKNGKKYFDKGEKMLKSLASREYLAEEGTNGHFILKHATGNFVRKNEVDGTLIYADYYFVEGLSRYIKIIKKIPL